MRAARALRRTWPCIAALAGGCKDPPPPPPPQEDPIVALAAALREPAGAGPTVKVEVAMAGANVPAVEAQLLTPLEHAMTFEDPRIEGLQGVALPGRAQLYVSFAAGTDPWAAMTAVRDAMPRHTLPERADVPWLERVDSDRAPIFAMLDTEPGPASTARLDALADTVARQPGVTKVRRCGDRRPMYVVTIDGARLVALGIAADEFVDRLRALPSDYVVAPDAVEPSALMAIALSDMVKLGDVASVRLEHREGSCKVHGVVPHPTLVISGAPEGLANAASVLRSEPGVRIWASDEPSGVLAMVATALPEGEREQPMLRWLARDDTPAWLVQDGDDPAWLLAAPRTQLRSFSAAAMHGLHMWWPGAPPPVTVRICGPELDTLSRTATTFAAGDHFGELLDDVAVWVPPTRPELVTTPDRERAAALGVSMSALGDALRLLGGDGLGVHADVRFELARGSTLAVRGTSGLVPLDTLVTQTTVAEPAFIVHVDRQRCVSVDLQPRRAEDRERIVETVQRTIELPVGVFVTVAPP